MFPGFQLDSFFRGMTEALKPAQPLPIGHWYRLNALSFQRKLDSSMNASSSGFLRAQE